MSPCNEHEIVVRIILKCSETQEVVGGVFRQKIVSINENNSIQK